MLEADDRSPSEGDVDLGIEHLDSVTPIVLLDLGPRRNYPSIDLSWPVSGDHSVIPFADVMAELITTDPREEVI